MNWFESAELLAILFFLFGYVFLLFKRKLNASEASLLLGVFTAGLILLAPRMVVLALAESFVELVTTILVFIIGLLLAFVANAKGEYFVGRRIAKS